MYYKASVHEIIDYLTFSGRTLLTEKGLCVDWSGAGLELLCMAERVIIGFGEYAYAQPCYIKVCIDGKPHSSYAISTGKEKVLLTLSDDFHRISIFRITEGNIPLIIKGFEFYGSEIGVRELRRKHKIRLEFIGDSLTCGYGILGSRHSEGFKTYEEDVTAGFSWLAAAELDADARYIAISGQGIVKNCNGEIDTPIPLFYTWQTRSGREPADTSWIPDIIIISAGTNDHSGGVSKDEFRRGAEDFTAQLRSLHPAADIVWDYGTANDYYCETLQAMVAELSENDSRIHYLKMPQMNYTNELGTNGHPNARYAKRAVETLLPLLREIKDSRDKENN
jgi:lysophospholipase L1-like esterase